MTVRLFVGNLPYDATEAELRQHFSAVGSPTRVVMPVDRETGRPRGFAFVEFMPDAAQDAIRRLNGQSFKGRPLAISEARPREERPPGAGPGSFSGSRPPRPPMGGSPPGGARPMGGLSGPGRPMGGPGGSPRPMGPRSDDDAGGERRPARNFGPPAPRRDQKASAKKRSEGPKGPIPVRTHGRIYDVDDDSTEELEDFDNFATSRPQDDKEDESEE